MYIQHMSSYNRDTEYELTVLMQLTVIRANRANAANSFNNSAKIVAYTELI